MENSTENAVNRRAFLSTSARVTAGLTAAAVTGPQIPGARQKNDTIRVAVMGVRGRGRNHVEGFAKLAGVEVAAVCDVDSRVLDGPANRILEFTCLGRPGLAPQAWGLRWSGW